MPVSVGAFLMQLTSRGRKLWWIFFAYTVTICTWPWRLCCPPSSPGLIWERLCHSCGVEGLWSTSTAHIHSGLHCCLRQTHTIVLSNVWQGIYFSCLLALSKTTSTILDRSTKNGHLPHALDPRWGVFMMFACLWCLYTEVLSPRWWLWKALQLIRR